MKPGQVNALFKLMDLRYPRKPSIITINLDYPHWYELFQRKPLVDALLTLTTAVPLLPGSPLPPSQPDPSRLAPRNNRLRRSQVCFDAHRWDRFPERGGKAQRKTPVHGRGRLTASIRESYASIVALRPRPDIRTNKSGAPQTGGRRIK